MLPAYLPRQIRNPEAPAQIEAILARFPGPVTLPMSRPEGVLYLVWCFGLTVICTAIVIKQPSIFWTIGAGTILPFLAFASVYYLTTIVLPDAGLTLDADGFEQRPKPFFHRQRSRWSDVSDFSPLYAVTNAVFYVDRARKRGRYQENAAIGGGISDWSSYDLADLLMRWRERALREQHAAPEN